MMERHRSGVDLIQIGRIREALSWTLANFQAPETAISQAFRMFREFSYGSGRARDLSNIPVHPVFSGILRVCPFENWPKSSSVSSFPVRQRNQVLKSLHVHVIVIDICPEIAAGQTMGRCETIRLWVCAESSFCQTEFGLDDSGTATFASVDPRNEASVALLRSVSMRQCSIDGMAE
jgi:hypothetical protein